MPIIREGFYFEKNSLLCSRYLEKCVYDYPRIKSVASVYVKNLEKWEKF